jgi:hypothetical protein
MREACGSQSAERGHAADRGDVQPPLVPEETERIVQSADHPDRARPELGDHVHAVACVGAEPGRRGPEPPLAVKGQRRHRWHAPRVDGGAKASRSLRPEPIATNAEPAGRSEPPQPVSAAAASSPAATAARRLTTAVSRT